MNTDLHPYRSAPFVIAGRAPLKPAHTALAAGVALCLVAGAGASLPWWASNPLARATDNARAEMNAHAWVRSAYGVDPWVRCDGGACDVVVGRMAPFTLRCDTAPDGACTLGGAR